MPRKRRQPWLDQRGDTFYIFQFDPASGHTKRISLRTTDEVEARKRFVAFLTEGQDVLAGEARGSAGLTVTQGLDDYWREHVTSKNCDPVRAENAIRHLKAWFGSTCLKDIDIPASRAYAEARRTGAVGGGKRRKSAEGSDSTIRRELVVLNAAARHALRWRRIGANELPSIELPAETRKDAITEDDWLTKAELKKAVDSATGKLKDFMVIAYDSASRRTAVERLTRFQVDLKAGRVNLRGPDETENQKRSKKRRPVVPITAAARPTYERLLEETATEFLFGVPADMYRPFHNHMVAIGLGHKGNPHILRHSRATHLLQDGVPIFAVAKLLGDTVATVERVYGHTCPNFLGDVMKEKA